MVRNNLYLSLKRKCITYQGKYKPLNTQNYTLTYNWTPKDTAYIFHTDHDLRQIHREFGHPAIRAIEKLLNRASDNTLKSEEKKMIQKIAQTFHIYRINATLPRRFKLPSDRPNFASTTVYR